MDGNKMKRKIFVGTLNYYKHLNCSYYGNPAYYGEFVNENGERLSGRTASNASCAYGFLNSRELPREIEYHETRTGNIIFDYIRILNPDGTKTY